MATQTDIINLALYKLAQSVSIPSITDESKAADVMARLWPTTRDLVLAERPWPWAMKCDALALVAGTGLWAWSQEYAYPNDCITALAITTGDGVREAGRIACFADPRYLSSVWGRGAFDWETAEGKDGTVIRTNVGQALLVYVARVTDTNRYPPPFVEALACRLAAEAGPPLIGDVGLNAKGNLLQEYELALTKAGAHSMNESRDDNVYLTPALAARGGY